MASKNTPGMSGQRATKEERRAEAREKARLLKEAEQKRSRRNKIIGVIVGLLVVAAIVIALIQVFSKSEIDSKYNGDVRPLELQNVTDDYGITLNGDGVAGQVVEGAPEVTLGSDFMCPGCQQLDLSMHDTYVQYAQAGDISFKLLPVATQGQNLSYNGAAAMFYVATFAPEYAWDLNYRLMQAGYEATQGGTQASPDQIADIALEIGVPEDVVTDMPVTIASDDWRGYVDDATASFRDAGYSYTPTVLVDGELSEAWLDGQMPQLLEAVATGQDISALESAGATDSASPSESATP